jgi:hypothetical protein
MSPFEQLTAALQKQNQIPAVSPEAVNPGRSEAEDFVFELITTSSAWCKSRASREGKVNRLKR